VSQTALERHFFYLVSRSSALFLQLGSDYHKPEGVSCYGVNILFKCKVFDTIRSHWLALLYFVNVRVNRKYSCSLLVYVISGCIKQF